jgi:hypothetical protein
VKQAGGLLTVARKSKGRRTAQPTRGWPMGGKQKVRSRPEKAAIQ